ncbi:LysR family transcriptional regulator [Paralimibaculum aggregatum]|uniref:LysR family transcriptional regulator n=1 Tax=Paralimibaculum aggregatum TaxID=3036245 RepID=A0ABQ6LR99_9RHOB|nr:LysR family transcriptional regulator [Limibaculum sp. NKW23]GMG83978.1 LysR family transcriptional regulator [Limibaculum sp. NKW23]
MELSQIRYFLAACQTLNFTRAAEACDVAVPTLSRAISKLEEELGGQLFRRERHLTHLTDLGRLMQTHLAAAHAATDAARTEAEKYAAAETRLRIGVISTISASHLVNFLRALAERAPGLDLDIWESHCADIAAALENAEIDIALMTQPSYAPSLRAEKLYEEPYLVAFAPGHRFEAMNAVPLAELDGEDYVKRLHCEFPSNFRRLGIDLPYRGVRVRYSTEREDWVQSMVASGLGCTLMPQFLPIMRGIQTRQIVDPVVTRTVSVVTRSGRRHSAAVEHALATARALRWQEILPAAQMD